MNTDAAADDEDLDKAPDGSVISTEHEEREDDRARGPDGRFVTEEEEEEAEETDDADKPKKGKKDKAVVEKEKGEEEEEEEEEADSDPKKKKTGAVETEEEQEEEEADEPPAPKKGGRLNARIQKLTQRAKDAEARANQVAADLAAERAAARRGTDAAKQKSELDTIKEGLDALYEQVEKHRADGESPQAAKVQRKIDEQNRRITELETLPKQQAATAQTIAAERFNTLLDVTYGAIPELDPEHDDYNEDGAKEMEFQIQAYERMGMPSDKALRRAAILLYKIDPLQPAKKGGKAEEEAEEEEEEETDDKKPKPKKKTTNVERNLDASKRAVKKPDRTSGTETDGTIDINKLTDDEFDAIPDSKLDELGGSAVAQRRR
jgi:hypothetical protein